MFQQPPLSVLYENGSYGGVVFDFIDILKVKYGFEYDVKFPSKEEDNIMGDANSGIMGKVYNNVSIANSYLSN